MRKELPSGCKRWTSNHRGSPTATCQASGSDLAFARQCQADSKKHVSLLHGSPNCNVGSSASLLEPQTFCFIVRVELFCICGGFNHSVAFLSNKRCSPCGLEREMPFENVVIQHIPILILPTSQTQLWTGISCSRQSCSLSKFDRDSPKILLSTGVGRARQPWPKSVGQSTATGEKTSSTGAQQKQG